MATATKAHSVRSQSGKVSTQATPVLPLSTTVKAKPTQEELIAKALDLSSVGVQIASLLKADETGSFERAKIAYDANKRGLTNAQIAGAVAKACARQDGATDDTVDALAVGYAITGAKISRMVDSYAYPVRHGIVPDSATVAATYRLLNNNGGDPATALDSIGGASKGNADDYLAGIRSYMLQVQADKAAKRASDKAEREAAKGETADGAKSSKNKPSVPASPEVLVQAAVEALAALAVIYSELTADQIAEVREAAATFAQIA